MLILIVVFFCSLRVPLTPIVLWRCFLLELFLIGVSFPVQDTMAPKAKSTAAPVAQQEAEKESAAELAGMPLDELLAMQAVMAEQEEAPSASVAVAESIAVGEGGFRRWEGLGWQGY
jgi:hypothetical protein